MTTQEITQKLCECGCGQPTPMAKTTDKRHGPIKGQPLRFIRGHSNGRPIQERFWEKVDKRGPDECWEWQGYRDEKGYGIIRYEGESRKAHRVSYILHNGTIADGMDVLHRCDNPPCCNPAHLFEGTPADNSLDMMSKGRNKPSVGSRNGRAILTESDIPVIFQMASEGMTHLRIATRYGVSEPAIQQVLNRRSWRHLE